jgi:hypothetical protein
MSNVIFEGDGPFNLPIAQQATAQSHPNNAVTVTFRVSWETGSGSMALKP